MDRERDLAKYSKTQGQPGRVESPCLLKVYLYQATRCNNPHISRLGFYAVSFGIGWETFRKSVFPSSWSNSPQRGLRNFRNYLPVNTPFHRRGLVFSSEALWGALGNKAYFANHKFLKSKSVTQRSKLKLYKTVIRPVVIYASETWVFKEAINQKLMIFERKFWGEYLDPQKKKTEHEN